MSKDIQALVKRVVCEQLGVFEDDATDDKRLITDLGADSLDHIELVIALEDKFDIELSDEEAEHFTNATIPEIATAIGMRLAAKAT